MLPTTTGASDCSTLAARPRVTIHYAQTLDGRIATRTGQSQWISDNPSLRLAHELRASHQAVMVGVGTVIADNPRLTVRHVRAPNPVRVVLDSALRLPLDCNLLMDRTAETIVVTTPRAAGDRCAAVCRRGASLLVVEPDVAGRVDLHRALERLGERGIESVLLEGGSGLITAAMRDRLVDRVIVCIAPKVLGAGTDAVGDLDIHHLSRALTFDQARFYPLGVDVIFDGVPSPPTSSPTGDAAPKSPSSAGRGGERREGVPRAIWFPRPRTVELRTEPVAEVGPRDLRVRAVASGISHGTEMLVYRGQVPSDLALDLPTFRGSFAFPIKYGYASVGRVVQVGDEVTDFRVDDLAFVLHPHQTEYVVPARLATRLPSSLDPALGVFLANLETAVNVTLDAHPRLGERVVVLGQGVVGLLITQLLRRAGAGQVIAVDPLPMRRDLARSLGADAALAPDADLVERIRELTDGSGADLAVEISGNAGALQAAIEAVAFQGTVVVASWYGTKPVNLALGGAFHRGRVRLISSQVGHLDPALEPRWTFARRMSVARDLLPRLILTPLITHRYQFDHAGDAYALIDEHPERVVQVVLTY